MHDSTDLDSVEKEGASNLAPCNYYCSLPIIMYFCEYKNQIQMFFQQNIITELVLQYISDIKFNDTCSYADMYTYRS